MSARIFLSSLSGTTVTMTFDIEVSSTLDMSSPNLLNKTGRCLIDEQGTIWRLTMVNGPDIVRQVKCTCEHGAHR